MTIFIMEGNVIFQLELSENVDVMFSNQIYQLPELFVDTSFKITAINDGMYTCKESDLSLL